jgi:hypothetical protein
VRVITAALLKATPNVKLELTAASKALDQVRSPLRRRQLNLVFGGGGRAACCPAITAASRDCEEPDMPPRQLVVGAVTKDTVRVGEAKVVESDSPVGRYRSVFEDDGSTGYFYALDTTRPDNPIIDALHVYDVERVADRERACQLHILWSADGLKTALFLNSSSHATYNFEGQRGCCRTGFPPTAILDGGSHVWADAEMEHFHAPETGCAEQGAAAGGGGM